MDTMREVSRMKRQVGFVDHFSCLDRLGETSLGEFKNSSGV